MHRVPFSINTSMLDTAVSSEFWCRSHSKFYTPTCIEVSNKRPDDIFGLFGTVRLDLEMHLLELDHGHSVFFKVNCNNDEMPS